MSEAIILVSVVVSAVCLVLIMLTLRQGVNRLDELTKTFHHFRGSLSEVISSHQDEVQASRERVEEEGARSLMKKEGPA